MQQPVARKAIVTDTYFGTTIDDPYRWMEDWHGEELRSWVEQQGASTRTFLDALPERAALLQRITELGDASPALSNFAFTGEHFFYLRRDPGEKVGKLVLRKSLDAPERVLLNPNTMAGEVHTSIDWYSPSSQLNAM